MIEKLEESLKRKFVKDYGIPVAVLDDRYWDYFVDLYDSEFDVKRHLANFETMLSSFADESAYSEYWKSLLNSISLAIEESNSVDALLSHHARMQHNYTQVNYVVSDVNKEHRQGKLMVSVDMKEANFSSLLVNYPEGILSAVNWYELISQFTPHEYIRRNKQFRQHAFGNLKYCNQNAKHQAFLMNKVALQIDASTSTANEYIKLGNDEFYWLVPDGITAVDAKLIAEGSIVDANPIIKDKFKVRPLTIKKVHPQLSWYIHTPACECGWKGALKAVPVTQYAQAYKYWKNQPIEPNDLIFMQDGILCQFIDQLVPKNA